MQQIDASNLTPTAPSVKPCTLIADDDFELGASVFSPAERPLGTVLIHGATAVPAGYYRRFAEYLARHGLRVVTYDYRGVGLSRPPRLRGFQASLSDWALRDAAAAQRFVEQTFGTQDQVNIGHSFGGQLMGLLEPATRLRGSLLVGTQLGFYGHWSSLERIRLGFIWRALVPGLTATLGYLPGQAGLGEDLPRGVAEEWARWCSSPNYLFDYYPDAHARIARYRSPVRMYSFSDDTFAPAGAVEAFRTKITGTLVDHRELSPASLGEREIGHFGFFRPRFEANLWREAREFLEGVLQA